MSVKLSVVSNKTEPTFLLANFFASSESLFFSVISEHFFVHTDAATDDSKLPFFPLSPLTDLSFEVSICPISPAFPLPLNNLPSEIIPPPTPVPKVNIIKFEYLVL